MDPSQDDRRACRKGVVAGGQKLASADGWADLIYGRNSTIIPDFDCGSNGRHANRETCVPGSSRSEKPKVIENLPSLVSFRLNKAWQEEIRFKAFLLKFGRVGLADVQA